MKEVAKLFAKFSENGKTECDELLEEIRCNAGMNTAAKALISGMVVHKHDLLMTFLVEPTLFTEGLAPLFLRPMLELVIRLAWIMKEPNIRSTQLIVSDLQQYNQAALKGFEFAAANGLTNEQLAPLKLQREWLDSEDKLWSFTAPGHPILELRSMAREVGGEIFKLYRTYFIPTSSVVHSTWDHLMRWQIVHSPNPLHRHVKLPLLRTKPQLLLVFPLLTVEFWDEVHKILRARPSQACAILVDSVTALSSKPFQPDPE